MRRRLLASTLTIVVAILVLFGVPLGVVLDRSVHADAKSRLQAEAARIGRELGRQPLNQRTVTPDLLERLVPSGDRALVISQKGVILASSPPIKEPITATVTGPSGEVVRVETPSDTVDSRVRTALLAVILLGLTVLGAAVGLALIQSRRLADPLDRLARSATRLGDGDFSLSTPRSGVPEIDAIASSLDRSAERVEASLRAERSFSEHASHQLRTALTGLQLRIEELAGNDDPAVPRGGRGRARAKRPAAVDHRRAAGARPRTGRAGSVSRFDLSDLVRQHVDDVEPILGSARVVGPSWTRPRRCPCSRRRRGRSSARHPAVERRAARCRLCDGQCVGRRAPSAASTSPTRARASPTATNDRSSSRSPVTTDTGSASALAHTLVSTEGGTITLLASAPPVFRVELPARLTNSLRKRG